jgi:hypothetical protein
MTWHADQTEGRPAGDAREKLLNQRAALVTEIEVLSMQPLRSKTQSAQIGRQEDLFALAKKVGAIDRKLGRITS